MNMVHNLLIKLLTDIGFQEKFEENPELVLQDLGIEKNKWDPLKQINLKEIKYFSVAVMKRRTNRLLGGMPYSCKLIGETKFKSLLKEYHYSYPLKPYQYPTTFYDGRVFLEMIKKKIYQKEIHEAIIDIMKYELAISYMQTKRSLVKSVYLTPIESLRLSLSSQILMFNSFYDIQKLLCTNLNSIDSNYLKQINRLQEKVIYILFKDKGNVQMIKVNENVARLLSIFRGEKDSQEYVRYFLEIKKKEHSEFQINKYLKLLDQFVKLGILTSDQNVQTEREELFLENLLLKNE
jgi:hypothetical protein